MHRSVGFVRCALYVVHCTLYVVRCALFNRFCTLCFVPQVLYVVLCYREHCASYVVIENIVHRALYVVRCTSCVVIENDVLRTSYVVHYSVGFCINMYFLSKSVFKLALYCVLNAYTELFHGLTRESVTIAPKWLKSQCRAL